MYANRLKQEDAKEGAILDGFPRTIEQAEKLDEILKDSRDIIISLEPLSIKRLSPFE